VAPRPRLRADLADYVWSTLGGSLTRHEFWGCWTVAGYVGMILGLRAFVRGVVPTIGGSRLLLIALCVAAVGDAGAYWGDG
jgi:hypothetical protein